MRTNNLINKFKQLLKMKATDLRINDIVLYHYEPCYVIGISDSFTKIQFPDNSELTVLTKELEPCEIFSKYLRINNFQEYPTTKFIYRLPPKSQLDNRNICLYFNSNDESNVYLVNGDAYYGKNSILLANIRYMHELQHILTIFGKEISL